MLSGGSESRQAGPPPVPGAPGTRNASRFQREISQPFRAVSAIQSFRPSNVPVTIACWGPPYWSVQTVSLGVGANGFAIAVSFRHAAPGFATVPLAGAQRSVYRAGAPLSRPSDQTLILRLVAGSVAVAALEPAPQPTAAARAAMRSAARTGGTLARR